MTRRKTIITLSGLTLLCAYLGYWSYWGNGVVLVKSTSPYSGGHSTVIVRKFPSTPPLLAHFLGQFPHTAMHRCEWYFGDSSALFSAHSYFADSLNARNADVEWDESGGGIIYIAGAPRLAMDRSGFWREIK